MPKGPKGPRALKFYQSAGFCKIYYSHFIFEVITFLSKIQNHTKKLSNYGSFKKIGKKTTTLKFWNKKLEGKTTTPQNCVLTNFFAWKEYNFPSGFLTNMILNFAQEWLFLEDFQSKKRWISLSAMRTEDIREKVIW